MDPITLAPMTDSSDRVREFVRSRLADRGLDMANVSLKLGKNRTYIQQYLTKKSPKWLPEEIRLDLAVMLGVQEIQLRKPVATGEGSVNQFTKPYGTISPDRLTHLKALPNDGAQETYLRVLGMAEGGPDGWNLFNGEEIGRIPRPANLLGVAGAYAVYITGPSMEPRYLQGELAHINPHKPVTPGSYVLVQKKPKGPGEAPLAVIKRLVKRSGNRVIISQHNPAKEFELKADEIVSMHRVVGSSEA